MSEFFRLPPFSTSHLTVMSPVRSVDERPTGRTLPMSKPSVKPGELVIAPDRSVLVSVAPELDWNWLVVFWGISRPLTDWMLSELMKLAVPEVVVKVAWPP